MSGPEAKEGGDAGAPSLDLPDAPFLHVGLFALGAALVAQLGTGIFVTLWLQQRHGRQQMMELAEDGERLARTLERLPPLELFEITSAGLGLALFYTLLLWRLLRRGAVEDIGLPPGGAGYGGLALGLVQGATLIAGIALGGIALGALRYEGLRLPTAMDGGGWQGLGLALGLVFLAAFCEEVITRGYMYQVLRRTKGLWVGILVPTLFFGLGHLTNEGSGPLGVLGTSLAGLYFALATVRDGHLWRAVGIHWGWNFVMGFVFSLPVSGIAIEGLVAWETQGDPSVWLGGTFGPEAGILGIGALALGCAYEGWRLKTGGIPPLPAVVGLPVGGDEEPEEDDS